MPMDAGRIALLLVSLILFGACTPSGGPTRSTSGAELAVAQTALALQEYARAVDLVAPLAPQNEAASLLLARGRLGLAGQLAATGEAAHLRVALDQVALGLAVVPTGHTLANDLATAEARLVEQLAPASRPTGLVPTATLMPAAPTQAAVRVTTAAVQP